MLHLNLAGFGLLVVWRRRYVSESDKFQGPGVRLVKYTRSGVRHLVNRGLTLTEARPQ